MMGARLMSRALGKGARDPALGHHEGPFSCPWAWLPDSVALQTGVGPPSGDRLQKIGPQPQPGPPRISASLSMKSSDFPFYEPSLCVPGMLPFTLPAASHRASQKPILQMRKLRFTKVEPASSRLYGWLGQTLCLQSPCFPDHPSPEFLEPQDNSAPTPRPPGLPEEPAALSLTPAPK